MKRKVGFTKNTAMRQRRVGGRAVTVTAMLHRQRYRVIELDDDDDDVYYYIRWRLKLEGETENTGVCTKERKGCGKLSTN